MTGVCVICGRDFSHLRQPGRFCSGSCRAECARIKAILDGSEPRFPSLALRLSKASRSAPWASTLPTQAEGRRSIVCASERAMNERPQPPFVVGNG